MNTTYGEVLRTRRKGLGLSLREMGERTGIHLSNLQKVETGRWKPPISHKLVLRTLKGLGYEAQSVDGQLLILLAAVENGIFPKWVKEDEKLQRDVAAYIWKRRAQ